MEVPRGRQQLAGALGLVVLAAIVALCLLLQRPPEAARATVPATEFSAERAYADLRRIAGDEPTPIGSVASDAIRDYLVAALSNAGFSVEVQTGLGSQTFHNATVAGPVNVVGRTLRL